MVRKTEHAPESRSGDDPRRQSSRKKEEKADDGSKVRNKEREKTDDDDCKKKAQEADYRPKKELITARDLKRTMIKKGELTVVQSES